MVTHSEAGIMKHILSWSGGKDSTASGILAKERNLPIDGIITVMPDPFKLEYEFMERFQEYMQIPVTVVEGPTFDDYFFTVKTDKAKHAGIIYGWPMTTRKACQPNNPIQTTGRCASA